MELTQELSNNLLVNNEELTKRQNNFIDSTLGKTNFIEDDIINIKDQILKNGFNSGIVEAIKSAKSLRKINSRNSNR